MVPPSVELHANPPPRHALHVADPDVDQVILSHSEQYVCSSFEWVPATQVVHLVEP